MKDRIERYWTARARAFDHLYALSGPIRLINRVLRRAVYQRYALTFEHAGDVTGLRVLDVGCGSGRYSVEFAERGAAEVVGVDFSEDMLALAREHAVAAGVAERCRFALADFDQFTDPQRFGVTIAIGFFDYVSDPGETLRRLRALADGRVLASFPAPDFPRSQLRRIRYGSKGVRVRFYRPAEIRRLAQAAGFRSVQVLPLSGGSFLIADT